MKRFIYIIALVAFVVACKKDQGLGSLSDEKLITFSTSVETTRASESTNTQLQGHGFNVSAYLDENDYNFLHYFDGGLTYNNGWICDNPQFWPTTGAITFDCYGYDKALLAKGSGTVIQSGRTLEYCCPSSMDEQIDLLATSQKVENREMASLNFEHILSQILFQVDFSATTETNVTLAKINVSYHNITSKATYTFGSDGDCEGTTSGKGVWTLGNEKFGDGFSSTFCEPNLTEKKNDGADMIFEPTTALMIIPQPVVISTNESDVDSYISVSVEYTLNTTNGVGTTVETGYMELPAPSQSTDGYEMGKAYTYNIEVNGKTLAVSVDIADAQHPGYAYGNIDLRLITESLTLSEYNSAIGKILTTKTTEDRFLYYSTAVRVAELLNDGVRDFVVVGSFGASNAGTHDGKLGYYGGESSPFFTAPSSLGMMPDYTTVTENEQEVKIFDTPNPENLFSIDLRGVYNFPTFGSIHSVTTTDHTLDPSAEVITDGVFKDVALLREVIFPKGLLAIGEYAFQNCISLETVDVSEIQHIEEGAFVDCKSLVTVKGDALTRIHANGFKDCVSLESIDISNVKEIDDFGFSNCKSLNNIDLEKIDVLGKHAFDGCISLTCKENSKIPDFTSIADYAFSACSKLCSNGHRFDLSLTTYVGDHAFNACNELLLNNGELKNIEKIGCYGFANCKKIGTNYDLYLDNISSLGYSAFENSPYINIVSGLGNLSKITKSAFQGCKKFTGYKRDETDDSKKFLDLPLADSVGDLAFLQSAITDIRFNNSKLKAIGNYAFNNCEELHSISGLEGVESIGEYSFAGSFNITELNLDNLTSGAYEFLPSNGALQTLYMPNLQQDGYSKESFNDYYVSNVIKNLKDVNVESLIIESFAMGDYINENATLKKINIAACKELGGGAFVKCVAMTECIASGATIVGGNAFQNCTALQSLDISSAISIGSWAFSGCSALETLNISSVTELVNNSLNGYDLPKLKNVDISSMPLISDGMFEGGKVLEKVIAPKATSLGNKAFFGCKALVQLDLSGISTAPTTLDVSDENHPFLYAVTNGCTLYLNQAQYDTYVSNGNVWCGVEWAEIIVK